MTVSARQDGADGSRRARLDGQRGRLVQPGRARRTSTAPTRSPASTLCPASVTLREGANQAASGTAIDAAGNSATGGVSGVNVDKTAPVLSGSATTSPNGNGWYRGDVVVALGLQRRALRRSGRLPRRQHADRRGRGPVRVGNGHRPGRQREDDHRRSDQDRPLGSEHIGRRPRTRRQRLVHGRRPGGVERRRRPLGCRGDVLPRRRRQHAGVRRPVHAHAARARTRSRSGASTTPATSRTARQPGTRSRSRSTGTRRRSTASGRRARTPSGGTTAPSRCSSSATTTRPGIAELLGPGRGRRRGRRPERLRHGRRPLGQQRVDDRRQHQHRPDAADAPGRRDDRSERRGLVQERRHGPLGRRRRTVRSRPGDDAGRTRRSRARATASAQARSRCPTRPATRPAPTSTGSRSTGTAPATTFAVPLPLASGWYAGAVTVTLIAADRSRASRPPTTASTAVPRSATATRSRSTCPGVHKLDVLERRQRRQRRGQTRGGEQRHRQDRQPRADDHGRPHARRQRLRLEQRRRDGRASSAPTPSPASPAAPATRRSRRRGRRTRP